jgi:hypothetical protein
VGAIEAADLLRGAGMQKLEVFQSMWAMQLRHLDGLVLDCYGGDGCLTRPE